MIVEFLMTLAANVFEWAFSGLPPYTPPAWVTGVGSAAGSVFSMAGSMGVWFPASLVLTIVAALLAVWLVSFSVKVIRMAISLFTGGGGSAA